MHLWKLITPDLSFLFEKVGPSIRLSSIFESEMGLLGLGVGNQVITTVYPLKHRFEV